MGECLITAVSGGSWVLRGNGWVYQGKQVSSGLLTPESIMYMDLVKIIRSKLRMEENIILKLSYYSLALPGIPPIYVSCDDDLEAYRFSNSRGKVFQTPLYCEVQSVEDEVKPFVIAKTEEIDVLSSAPEVETETQTMAGEKQVLDRKRKRENKTILIEVVCLLTDEEKEESDGEHDHSLLEISSSGSELDVVDLNDGEDVDGDLSDDSYLWWDKFVEKSSAKSARVACDGAGSSRAVIDLVDDSCNDVEDDEEEYNQNFFKELDEAELRALRSHHPYVEPREENVVGKAIQTALKSGGINVSYMKASRARQVAEAMVRCTAEESFMYIHSCLEMLKVLNLGSYTAIKTDCHNRFESCFWALGCTIRAIPQLRKVVSVDGAHLSGKFPGVLLMTVAQDPNNHIYPIAFSVVGSESKASWSFFFEHLKLSGGVPDSVETIVISDRLASIKSGMKVHYKLEGHGYCAYHLYHNLRPSGTGPGALQDQWFNVAKAYTVEDFEKEMDMLKLMAPRMAERAMRLPVESWSRAHCRYERFNIMTKNNSESLNVVLKNERAWPIISLFNTILHTMSRWFEDRRSKPGTVDDEPANRVVVTLDQRRMQSLSLRATRLSQHVAEVNEGFKIFEVDLRQRKRQCEVFQKDRIPCRHAFAAASELNVRVVDLLSSYYLNKNLSEMYKEIICVVPESWSQWTLPARVQCSHPLLTRGPGRQVVNR